MIASCNFLRPPGLPCSDLAVAAGGLGKKPTVLQVEQHRGNGGRADVDSKAAHGRVVILPGHVVDGECAVFLFTKDAHLPFRIAQRLGQAAHGIERQLDSLTAGRLLQRPGQALVVRHGILQCRLGKRQIDRAVVVVQTDAGLLHTLEQLLKNGNLLTGGEICGLHTAAVGGGDVRHLHRHVRAGIGAAGEPPAVGIFLIGNVGGLQALHFTGDQLHAALAAGAVAGAGRIDGDIGFSCRLQQRFLR